MSAPIVARKEPFKVAVQAGKTYWWCACGRSQTQPFCDGRHKGTAFEPVAYKAEASKDVFFCGCKNTGKSPLCDGSHSRL